MMDWLGCAILELSVSFLEFLLNSYINCGPNYARGMDVNAT